MNKLFKLLSLLVVILISIGLSSCEFISLLNSDQKEDSLPAKEVVQIGEQTIVINTIENDSIKNNIEDAVSAAYDSVVVIDATSSTAASSGSGVIIGESGKYSYIVTCSHVVDEYQVYDVTLANGETVSAVLKGADPISDLAVLMIEKTGLTKAAIITDSNSIKIGSDCFAIGNPLGTLGNSVTKGIISSTSRNIQMSDGSVHNLLQTDAAINSGNSGGGLFNNQGELIGIVSAKYSATGVEGLGFAIPANTVKSIITDLISKGYVEGRTSLGVTFSDGYYRSGSGFFGTYHYVVYVSYVDPNGSAYNLLQKNDILVSISVKFKDTNKQAKTLTTFENADDVNEFLDSLSLEVGDKVTFEIKQSTSATVTTNVEVELKQYIYKAN